MRKDLSAGPPPLSVSRRAIVAAAIAGTAALAAPAAARADHHAQADNQQGGAVARAARPHAPECLADLLPDGA